MLNEQIEPRPTAVVMKDVTEQEGSTDLKGMQGDPVGVRAVEEAGGEGDEDSQADSRFLVQLVAPFNGMGSTRRGGGGGRRRGRAGVVAWPHGS